MKRINLRAYAIIEHNDFVLVTDEFRIGKRMTKFPGGGHEWGEGLAETLLRECREELGQQPTSLEHFYTTDFFVPSAFHSSDQLVAVYYRVILPEPEKIAVKDVPFDFDQEIDGAQLFRWINRNEISADHFTYPIDQHVAAMLRV
ncbi:MAG: NUDIX hydrolase [Bacteroidota bacterium]|jgi:8-oxo-dGTP diphosphatase